VTTLAIRSHAEEQMDSLELDAETYARVLRDLARVNRWTFTAHPVLRYLDEAIGRLNRFRLLDVGFGAGDMLRAIARWAEKRGITAELVGVDLNPRSEAIARAATSASMAISYHTGDRFGKGVNKGISAVTSNYRPLSIKCVYLYNGLEGRQ